MIFFFLDLIIPNSYSEIDFFFFYKKLIRYSLNNARLNDFCVGHEENVWKKSTKLQVTLMKTICRQLVHYYTIQLFTNNIMQTNQISNSQNT